MSELTPVEKIKSASRGLRGTLADGFADPTTGGLADDIRQDAEV